MAIYAPEIALPEEAICDFLNKLGDVETILKSKDKLKKIIAGTFDRKVTEFFFSCIGQWLKEGDLDQDLLVNFRNGFVVDTIINLERCSADLGINRRAFEEEIANKLMWVAYIGDRESLLTTFTHPRILKDLISGRRNDLTLWSNQLYILPQEVIYDIAQVIRSKSDLNTAENFLNGRAISLSGKEKYAREKEYTGRVNS